MQIILNNQNRPKIFEKSLAILAKGGMIIYPSDTVYGIAVDATNPVAIDTVEVLKGRRPEQKFSFNFADVEMIEKFYSITDEQKEILEKYLPGPFTFILNNDLSVRIPKDSIITEITRFYGKPTTATSANLTGEHPIDSIKKLNVKIYLAADLIIEDSDFVGSPPSTIVDLRNKPYKVIRQGKLPFKE